VPQPRRVQRCEGMRGATPAVDERCVGVTAMVSAVLPRVLCARRAVCAVSRVLCARCRVCCAVQPSRLCQSGLLIGRHDQLCCELGEESRWEGLGKDVGDLLVGGNPLELHDSGLDRLADKMMAHINMLAAAV
jgi:hypothetical protein